MIRILELREIHGITQETLAKQVGVSRLTILFLEKGKYYHFLRITCKIARVFNISIDDVLFFDDES